MNSNIYKKFSWISRDEQKAKRHKEAQEQFLKDYKSYMLNKEVEQEYKGRAEESSRERPPRAQGHAPDSSSVAEAPGI